MKGLFNVAFAVALIVALAATITGKKSKVVEETSGANGPVVVKGGFPFKPAIDPVKRDFPELYSTEAIIAVFGAESCGPCQRTKAQLRPQAGNYNMVFYDVSKDHKHYKLMKDTLKLGSMVPVVAVIEKGKVVKAFHGYTPWVKIKPYAKKAKKAETDPVEIWIGPLTIDIDEDDVSIRVLDAKERREQRRLKRQDEGGRLRNLFNNERLQEYWIAIKTWVVENWATIARVAVMIFMLF